MSTKVITKDIGSSTFILRPWQAAVLKAITEFDEMMGSEIMQQLSDYDRNKECSLRAKWPKGSGHTTLTAYLAANFNSAVIYFDTRHFKELNALIGDTLIGDTLEKDGFSGSGSSTEMISVYKLYHDLNRATSDHSAYLGQERSRETIASKELVIVDRATELLDSNMLVSEWLFGIAHGQVVLLG